MSSKFFHSKGYKVFMNYVYGWGASAVIVGALFKIMHFPYGGYILSAGMIVEAIIFFLSAFEPQPENYKWSKVFPELSDGLAQSNSEGPLAGLNGQFLDKDNANALKEGISKLTETATGLSNISEAVASTKKYSESLNCASVSVVNLNSIFDDLSNSVGSVNNECKAVSQKLVDTGELMNEKISGKINELGESIDISDKEFQRLSSLVGDYAGFVKQFEDKYQGTVSNLTENMGALNALYEMQLKGTNEYIDKFSGIQKNIHEMADNISLTLDNTRLHKSESEALGKNISSLNTVYGNMLSVLNNGNK